MHPDRTGPRYCDGITRRDFLQVGTLGAAGLGLADYLRLGIDYRKEYHTSTGRPVTIVREGSVIRGLFA